MARTSGSSGRRTKSKGPRDGGPLHFSRRMWCYVRLGNRRTAALARPTPCAQAKSLWTVLARRKIAFCKQIEWYAAWALKATGSTAIGKAEALLVARTETRTNRRVPGIDCYVSSPADGPLRLRSGVVRTILPGPTACLPYQLAVNLLMESEPTKAA